MPNIKAMEKDITALSSWSGDNGLVFNNKKLQCIFFSKSRSASTKTDRSYLVRSQGQSIKQDSSVKLLGVTFDENLSWNEQVNNVTKSTYGILRTLKHFKRFTPMNVRKTLAASLILSKLNYCNVVYAKLPIYLQNRLQRVQTCAAGYVFGRYATLHDVIKLNWLPIEENIEFCVAKYTFKSIKNHDWPSYLQAEMIVNQRNLRSSERGPRMQYGDPGTFQQQTLIFNDLPTSIRLKENFEKFYIEAKRFYKDKALARVLSM